MTTNSKNIVIVPYKAIPHGAYFRYGNEWWIRTGGTLNCAHTAGSASQKVFEQDCLVGLREWTARTSREQIMKFKVQTITF